MLIAVTPDLQVSRVRPVAFSRAASCPCRAKQDACSYCSDRCHKARGEVLRTTTWDVHPRSEDNHIVANPDLPKAEVKTGITLWSRHSKCRSDLSLPNARNMKNGYRVPFTGIPNFGNRAAKDNFGETFGPHRLDVRYNHSPGQSV